MGAHRGTTSFAGWSCSTSTRPPSRDRRLDHALDPGFPDTIAERAISAGVFGFEVCCDEASEQRVWTEEDTERLRLHIAHGASAIRAAAVFRRTEQAVRSHAAGFGWRFPTIAELRRKAAGPDSQPTNSGHAGSQSNNRQRRGEIWRPVMYRFV